MQKTTEYSNQRNCPDCGSPVYGRKDRIFCSDSCRINFHNTKYSCNHKMIRSINSRLKTNRNILQGLISAGTDSIAPDYLESLGYYFSFHTHNRPVESGEIAWYCYEFGYYMKNGQAILVLDPVFWKPGIG